MSLKRNNFYDESRTLHRIGQRLHQMTPINKKIGEYVLRDPESVIKMSISQLARESGARSESSVVRFYQFIGYTGYHDFKVSLATDIAGQIFFHANEDIDSRDNVGTIKTKLFEGAIHALQQNVSLIKDEALEEAVDAIAGASRLIFIGYAASAALAYDACFKFTRLGLHCHFISDPHMNAVLLSHAEEGDVVLAISQSGETRDLVTPLRAARPPIKIVSIAGEEDSSLSRISDVYLATKTEERNYRTDALISRIVQKVMISVLYTGVALRRGESIMDVLHASRRALSYLKF